MLLQHTLTTSIRAPGDPVYTMTRDQVLLWAPRILGIALALFLCIFALDAFEPHKPFTAVLTDLAVHLVPAALVLAIVVLAWKWPFAGGVGFVLLALGYALSVGFRIDWVMVISGPMLMTGLLFLWSWRLPVRRLL
jgi:hypothetical protein